MAGSASSAASFKYKPFASRREIRLLEILPPSLPPRTRTLGPRLSSNIQANSPLLRCRLTAVSFHDGTPEYIALSYCWGDADRKVSVYCEGGDFDGTLSITHSLYTALNAIRRRATGSPRFIWADGICIDQQNKQEKSWQVKLMAALYHRASHVLVWLGEGGRETEPAFAAIRKFAYAMSVMPRASALTMSMYEWLSLGFHSREEAKYQIRAFYKLIQRPYFTRTWVVQELAMAKQPIFMCGEVEIDEASLMNASAWLASSSAAQGILNWSANPMLLLHSTKSEELVGARSALLNLLANYRHRGASERVDKIYALCSLASDVVSTANGLSIDPELGYGPQELFKDITIQHLARDKDLEIITMAGIYTPLTPDETEQEKNAREKAARENPLKMVATERRRLPDLPSWVPDWGVIDNTCSVQCLEFVKPDWTAQRKRAPAYMFPSDLQPTEFRACGFTSYSPRLSSDENGLIVQGMRIDTINTVGLVNRDRNAVPEDWWREPSDSEQMDFLFRSVKTFQDWIDTAGVLYGGFYFNGQQLLDAFWQTIRSGHFPHGIQQERAGFIQWYQAIQPIIQIHRTFSNNNVLRNAAAAAYNQQMISSGIPSPAQSFMARTAHHTFNKSIFKTNTGKIGLAPNGTSEGDEIMILKGGFVPLIIRTVGRSKRLIGACYLHGCMHGEVFDPQQCQEMVIV